MNSNMLGPLLLGCFLVLVLFVVHRIMARRGRRLAVVAALFGGEHKKGFLGDYYLCSYNGKPFRLEIWEGTRNHPQSLRVILLSPVAFNLLARTASFSDTMMEKLGARDDIRVGDGLFDERYLISASNPTAAQELFLAPEVRAAAASLMDAGFCIMADKDGLLVELPRFEYDRDVAEATVKKMLDSALVIDRVIPHIN